MGSLELQASSSLVLTEWHGINWAACHRRVRSLPRRIVQAVQAGAWRKVKRLSYLLVRSFAARAVAVKRVTENRGKKTPGMDGDLWDTPEKKAQAIERIGRWQGYRPKRQCTDAIDQCFKVLRRKSSATWTLEEELEQTVRARIDAFLADRGLWLSPTKTVITPLHQGFDFLGQTIRKAKRPNSKPAKLQITPSRASFQAVKAKIKALCKQARTPQELIETLNPVLRGWATYHRRVICGEIFAKLDDFVWRRTYRWPKHRHANQTGRWIAMRYFPHQPGEPWRFTDPRPGKHLIRVQQAIKGQRHLKIKAHANPFDPKWEAYFQPRDRQLTLRVSSAFRGKVLRPQQGLCPVCRQVIQYEEEIELHHRDGNHQNN